MTNLATLKARVRQIVDDCSLGEGECMMHQPEGGCASFFLKERLVDELGNLMQRHEEWAQSQLARLRCTKCKKFHNQQAPCPNSSNGYSEPIDPGYDPTRADTGTESGNAPTARASYHPADSVLPALAATPHCLPPDHLA